MLIFKTREKIYKKKNVERILFFFEMNRCGSLSHDTIECNRRLSSSSSSEKANLTCIVCGEKGHLNCGFTFDIENKQKLLLFCPNCGGDDHVACECDERTMPIVDFARGLKTSPEDPNHCFKCLNADHESRNCPLNESRTKRHYERRNGRNRKYKSSSSSSKYRNRNSRSKKWIYENENSNPSSGFDHHDYDYDEKNWGKKSSKLSKSKKYNDKNSKKNQKKRSKKNKNKGDEKGDCVVI